VYIREAHPSDAWQMAVNVKEDVVFASPKSIEEKTEVAQMCVRKLGIEFPAVVDNFDNSTEVAYSGWPDRLYVIDREGRIAYKARPGPFGFLPDEMAQTLARLAP
jgi:type I thyroxine 5'-deiodinase